MKKYFFFILGYLCYSSIIGQTSNYFNNRYRFDRPCAFFSGMILQDSFYYIVGVTCDSLSPYYAQSLFTKMDKNGRSIFKKTFGLNWGEIFIGTNTLIKTGEGGFADVGYIQNTSGLSGLFMKFDSAQNATYFRQFKDTLEIGIQSVFPHALYQTIDKGFLICGDYQMPDLETVKLFIIKLDSLGNFEWKKIYDTIGWDAMEYHSGFVKTHNNTYLIGARKANASTSDSYTWLLEVDSLGNKIREYIDTDSHTWAALGLKETSDHGYVYGGYYRIDTFVNTHYNRGHIVKMDSNFNKKWELIIGRSYDNTGFNDLELLPNGDIIAAGQVLDGIADTLFVKGWVVKVSPSGNIIWERRYAALDSNHLPLLTDCTTHDVDIDDKGNILLCGESFSVFNGNYPQRAWLLKLDPYGCLVPGCQNVGIETATETKQVLSLYPNPAADMLYIYFHDAASPNGEYSFVIKDLQGKEIVPKTALSNSTTYLFSTHALAQGMYVLELFKGGEFVEVQKWIKE